MDISCPLIEEYINYKLTVQNRSPQTVEQYATDLEMFFKYIVISGKKKKFSAEEFDKTDISGIDIETAKGVTTAAVYSFLQYVTFERGNKPAARARKLSAIKGFYKYMTVTRRYLSENPAKDIESPKVKTALPKYLTLEESLKLLDAVESDAASKTRQRDFAIITLFLNCGMRLSELVGINLTSLDPELRLVRVVGKGSKERIIYLNEACRQAVSSYLQVRATLDIKDKNALFISRLGTRVSNKTVQWMVYKYLKLAGLGYRKLSTHKLRHTAATLMYQSGQVDIRVLKDILGHEQLNTTQIYTHVSNEHMENAMAQNPLATHHGSVRRLPPSKSKQNGGSEKPKSGKSGKDNGSEEE